MIRKMIWRNLLWRAAAILTTLLMGGLFAILLVRYAPGFDADERQLDPHLSQESLQALRQSRSAAKNPFAYFATYLRQALHGDLGNSQSLDQPVSTLLRDRWRITFRLAAAGLAGAWLLALILALSAALLRRPAYDAFGAALSAAALCLPAAVLSLLAVLWRIPGEAVIACLVFPKVYRYTRNLTAKVYSQPHIASARSRGVSELRLLIWHVLPVVAPSMIALAGVTVGVALGACIPVESLLGLPGLGQLAWQAALARDLPLLLNLTLIVTLVTLLANASGDVIAEALRPHES